MPDEEKLYTLAEAKRKLNQLECDRVGCSVMAVQTIRGYDGRLKLRLYGCTRCGVEFVRKQ